MPSVPLSYVWLLWSLLLLFVWFLMYLGVHGAPERRRMMLVSAVTALFGFTEPLFVPRYWSPPSLFDLAHRTGFDIESLVFCFAAGGIVYILYEILFRKRHRSIPEPYRIARHPFHTLAVCSMPAIMAVLLVAAPSLDPIYDFFIAGTVGGILTLLCRPDLAGKMFASASLFLLLYYLYFLVLIATAPAGYVQSVWNLPALSGILVTGIPLEELVFAAVFGFYWSSLYEHLTWKRLE